jgi:alpha-ribazole phosphatase
MQLYLIRHTTPDIQKGTCYGQTDVDVKSTFDEELLSTKQDIGNQTFTHYYSSPLKRCHKLALALAGDNEVCTDDRLMELNFGDWEMLSWDDISATHESNEWFADFVNIPCPGGESYKQMMVRIRSFLDDIKTLPDDSNVMIVTHGGCIRVFKSLINNDDPFESFSKLVGFGSVCKLSFADNK